MAAQDIFPLAQWLEGTNQNSTPANDNALRMQALAGPAMGFANSAPSSPADYDQWVIGTTWGGHAAGNIVINVGGTWKEFVAFDGMAKVIASSPYLLLSGAWTASGSGSGGSPPAYHDYTADHSLVQTDAPATSAYQGIVSLTKSSAVNLTVTKSATVAWTIGTSITVPQLGTGQVTFVPDTGVTLKAAGALTTRTQNSAGVLIYLGADVWSLLGDLA